MPFVEMVGDVVDESIELPPSVDGFHIEPRCRVCRDDEVRTKANDLLATGTSFAMVLRALWGRQNHAGQGASGDHRLGP